MNDIPRRRVLVASAIAATLTATGCGAAKTAKPQAVSPSPTTATAAATAASDTSGLQAAGSDSSAASSLPTIPGYDVGDFPPVPLFTLPDLSLLDDSLGGFAVDFSREVDLPDGVTAKPAACGSVQERAAGQGTALLYGDGSGNYTGPDGTIVNYGDGSGTFTVGGVTATVYGDGSGEYIGDGVEIHNYGDGSGSVDDASGHTFVYGDGSGSFEGDGVEHWNYGDGSSMYSDGTVEIHNYGDGSGSYDAPGISIFNYGDGTADVNGTRIEAGSIAADAPIGTFPPLGSIAPMETCGTTITFSDGVLFDFGKDNIRDDAATVLDGVATALNDLQVPAAEIGGHTDSISSEEFNQALSERRAASVVAALQQRGVTAELTAVGYGETAPVAPNEVDGHDNPAGRQLNRRVEIFIPAF